MAKDARSAAVDALTQGHLDQYLHCWSLLVEVCMHESVHGPCSMCTEA